MEKISSTIKSLGIHLQEYLEVSVSLLKLRAAEKTSDLIADIAGVVVVSLFFIFFLLFVSFGCANLLSGVFGNNYSGFLIIGGFYLVLGLILWVGRKRIIRNPILNAIVRRLFENNNNHNGNN